MLGDALERRGDAIEEAEARVLGLDRAGIALPGRAALQRADELSELAPIRRAPARPGTAQPRRICTQGQNAGAPSLS
jgi:hypothetical protein